MTIAPVAEAYQEASYAAWAEASVVGGELNRVNARLVALAARVLEQGLWDGGGIRSVEHWLVLRVGLSPSRAAEVTRLARRREQLPDAMTALEEGQLSLEQASVLASYAPAGHQASVTEFARHATVPQLRRASSRYQFWDDLGQQGEREEADAGELQGERDEDADAGELQGRAG